jgi:hypothetical protein
MPKRGVFVFSRDPKPESALRKVRFHNPLQDHALTGIIPLGEGETMDFQRKPCFGNPDVCFYRSWAFELESIHSTNQGGRWRSLLTLLLAER